MFIKNKSKRLGIYLAVLTILFAGTLYTPAQALTTTETNTSNAISSSGFDTSTETELPATQRGTSPFDELRTSRASLFDELRASNRALTADEIKRLYNLGR